MRQSHALFFLTAAFFALGNETSSFAGHEAMSAPPSPETVLRSLRTNRWMRTQARLDYLKVERLSSSGTGRPQNKELENLEFKILALEEDAKRLQGLLPQELAAQEFLKDLLTHKAYQSAERSGKRRREQVAGLRPLPRPPTRPVSTATLHEQGLKLVSEERHEEAVRVYQEIVLQDPEDDQAHFILGHLYLLSGKYYLAAESFQNAALIHPENMRDIVPFYQNLLLQNPEDDTLLGHLGHAYLITGEPLDAADTFHEALRLNPDNPSALEGLKMLQLLE